MPDGSDYDDYGDSTPYETGGHTCDCAGMTEAEKREQGIDAEVANVLQEILARPDQDMEYGSLIYIERDGHVRHTPLTEATGYRAAFNLSVLPRNADGSPNYSSVVAIVHSHPQFLPHPETGVRTEYYRPGDPDHLLYPSRSEEWGGSQGDWLSYDHFAAQIKADGGDASSLAFYIIGYTEGGFKINEYGWEDRETNTSSSGEAVDPSTEACTC